MLDDSDAGSLLENTGITDAKQWDFSVWMILHLASCLEGCLYRSISKWQDLTEAGPLP